ncbi:alkaline phosphatase D family protein [Maribacter sp. 2307ULW6-5]|uniref:alkaline phosphatase D family protein n=1 Tax=Maribacter sp. 2307ULW6-5 TaxID=3386275 RepID=UPI0039BD519E
MKTFSVWAGILLLFSCAGTKDWRDHDQRGDLVIAFGSCNKTDAKNALWDDILATDPDMWIWGGDNIYADTDNMDDMAAMYAAQDRVPGYARLRETVPVVGTWDDHDYGLNDGGEEFSKKVESQINFLNFMQVPQDSPRREREGVYASHLLGHPKGTVKIMVLDTRYFRTPLTPDRETRRRIKPNPYGEGSLLGEAQWQWLSEELERSTAQFNVIVSSVQVLSNKHGFECWGNFPHEVDRLAQLIANSGAKGVMVLSGDRHISEFSRADMQDSRYPLVDFTSSGLTHAYRSFSGEPNPFRVGQVVAKESFGVVRFDFDAKKAIFEMRGNRGKTFAQLVQPY